MAKARRQQLGGEQTMASPLRDKSAAFREIINNPAVKYVAGGIASALMTKIITKMSDRYPEITRFLRENIDTLEQKLGEFQNQESGSNRSTDARQQ